MNVKIVFFSGTGNTKFLSEKLAEFLLEKDTCKVQVIPIETATSELDDLEREDFILGISYPVYDYMPPKIVLEFVSKLHKKKTPSKAFVFSTYTTNPLDSNYYLLEKLQDKGCHVIAQDNYRVPGASAYLYANPNNPLVKIRTKFSKEIDQRLHHFAEKISTSEKEPLAQIPIKYNSFNKVLQGLSKMTLGNLFYRNLKNNDDCINCGVCPRTCPDHNLIMKEGILHINKENGCMRCLRCVLCCPQKAINFTSSKRTGTYSKEVIENTYESAN